MFNNILNFFESAFLSIIIFYLIVLIIELSKNNLNKLFNNEDKHYDNK